MNGYVTLRIPGRFKYWTCPASWGVLSVFKQGANDVLDVQPHRGMSFWSQEMVAGTGTAVFAEFDEPQY